MRTRTPASTYRLQLRPGFGFAEAREALPYLEALGVTDLYSSPVLKARPGSTHGYDVTDPTQVNPELGGREGFDALAGELRDREMGLVLDVVPNHMAMGSENPWWMDVLEHGRASRYAAFFDVDWAAPGLEGRILVPVLGGPYTEVLDRGELTLTCEEGGFLVRYYEDRFPVDLATATGLLTDAHASLRDRLGSHHPVVRSLRRQLRDAETMPPRRLIGARSVQRRARLAESIHRRLRDLMEGDAEARGAVEEAVRSWGGDPSTEAARDRLDGLIAAQAYLLSYWRAAVHEIDYRRFFDVNELVSLRAQDPAVFDATHHLIGELVAGGQVTALRVDHVDGLRDPKEYLDRLGALTGGRAPVVVEKILAREEELPGDWAAAGTTGYDFLETASGGLVDPEGVARLGESYVRVTGQPAAFDAEARARKRLVMRQLFGSEVGALSLRLLRLARADRRGRDLTEVHLARALTEVTAALPVYRTYVRGFDIAGEDRIRIDEAVAAAREAIPDHVRSALDFLHRVLLLDLRPRPRPGDRPGPRGLAWLGFVIRWQQFSGPVMAKGVEDTAMYTWTRLLARNDVGTDPGRAGFDGDEVHRRLQARLRTPAGLNATSTHDTKRGEDVRARLAVLSDLPEEWTAAVEGWMVRNRALREASDDGPDPNEEWMLYQALLGSWPLRPDEEPSFADRMYEYVRKALREAKVHTNWIDPDEGYEEQVVGFVRRLMADRGWRAEFEPIRDTVAFHGAMNGLSQLVLKLAAPGVPDVYQGSELWNLSLVDPDNRHPLDVERHARMLADLDRDPPAPEELLSSWTDGRIKLWVTSRGLRLRRERRPLFDRGSYMPVKASGVGARHAVAFARRRGKGWALAVAPRSTFRLAPGPPTGPEAWGSSTLALPSGAPKRWTDVFTGSTVEASRARLPIGQVLGRFPVALLVP